MELVQEDLAKHPIHCTFCKKKTQGVVGSSALSKKSNRYFLSGGCAQCHRRRAGCIGGSVIDSFLKEWNTRVPEQIREMHLIQQPGKNKTAIPQKSSFCGQPGLQ